MGTLNKRRWCNGKNTELSPLVRNALQKKKLSKEMETTRKARENKVKTGMYISAQKSLKEKEIIQEAKISKVKHLVDENIKFLKSNDDVLLSDEIEFFITLLKTELQFFNRR